MPRLSQAREGKVGALGKPGHAVAELGQLHLKLAVGGGGPLSENIENQLGAIDDPQFHAVGQVSRLAGF